MKIWSFLRWKFNQITFNDICWYSGAGLLGYSVASNNQTFLFAAILLWLLIFVKMLFEHYKNEYQRFTQEQNKLFDTIKHSDQK